MAPRIMIVIAILNLVFLFAEIGLNVLGVAFG